MTSSFAFRVLGPLSGARQLVPADTAFAACCRNDPRANLDNEQYISAFRFGEDLRDHTQETGSVRGFAGPCWASWVWFDLDRENDLPAALADARLLASFLDERYELAPAALLIFFSGRKGFHVGLPTSLWAPEASVEFPDQVRQLAVSLATDAGVEIDRGVYDRVRVFRAPNSRHPRSGLRKRHLSAAELKDFSLEQILDLAKVPAAFEPPALQAIHPRAVDDWRRAGEELRARNVAIRQRHEGGAGPRLNRLTVDLIRNAAPVPIGERHRRLFSAAANLAEFGCSLPLALALLTEPGLDSGLPPSEVRRQIESGLAGASAINGASNQAGPAAAPASVDSQLQAKLRALWERGTPSPSNVAPPPSENGSSTADIPLHAELEVRS